ncbi:MAG: M48 family metalloprotease, partial [Alphaproteobacteria bacterium]|nr:M48 family metalloprotease [Alphaproteobacteria bacterium]
MKHIQKLFRLLMGAAIGISAGGVAPSSAQFITKSQESAIGAEEHPKIIKQYGGVYDEAQVSGYVAAVGGRIVANSEIPGVPFHFTVLDSPIVNAFALPGGYVYVTRGLIALANSEAELASVLAHEVGHVAARHTAQRYNRSVGMSLGGAILGALIGNQIVNNLVQQGGQLYLLSYSRDQ